MKKKENTNKRIHIYSLYYNILKNKSNKFLLKIEYVLKNILHRYIKNCTILFKKNDLYINQKIIDIKLYHHKFSIIQIF